MFSNLALAMRILYFSRDYTTHDRRFLSKLAGTCHEVWYLRLEDDGIPYEQRPLPAGVRAVAWSKCAAPERTPMGWLQLMPAFASILAEVRPDLVHAGPVQSCGFMTALSGFHPFLLMSWGSDILVDADRDELWRWVTRYALAHADMFLCDCRVVREAAQSMADFADERIIEFPWGIDLTAFAPSASPSPLRRTLGWENNFVILSTRAWEPGYGVAVLLEAFRAALDRNPRLCLLLPGTGSLAAKVKTFIEQHGLQDRVYMPGMVAHAELAEYFRGSDLYVSCAHSDGTSISLLEAMATGLPVLVTNRFGNREWVAEGINGWLAPLDDAAAFARAMETAARLSPAERAQIGKHNRAVALERANWDRNVQQLLAAYDRVELLVEEGAFNAQ